MKKLAISAILAGFVLFAIATTALATSSIGVTSTAPVQGNIDDIDVQLKNGEWKVKLDTKGPSTLAVSESTVAPGGGFGWHSHPGPSLVIVKSGTSTFYRGDDPDCTPEVHPAGTAYVDPGGVVHTARNEGTQPLVLLVIRLIPAGAMPRIDQADPGNCNF
jgi:quercetin dioxygenase-like cupin family protein